MAKGDHYLEIHGYGNLFLDEEVRIVYRHSPRGAWKYGTTISIEDLDVKVVDTRRYGYRFFDTSKGKFVSRSEVERRLAERIREWQNSYFGGDFIEMEGGVDKNGDTEWHGKYE